MYLGRSKHGRTSTFFGLIYTGMALYQYRKVEVRFLFILTFLPTRSRCTKIIEHLHDMLITLYHLSLHIQTFKYSSDNTSSH